MIIDFTDAELELIYHALEEIRVCSDDDEVLDMIESIFNKMWETSKNEN